MSTVAFIKRMLDAGWSHDDALRAAVAFEATIAEMAPVVDAAADRRRAKDRARKAEIRRHPQTSADYTESADKPPSSPPPSPKPPTTPTPTPGDISTRERQAAFEEFWRAYPSKVGKGAARTAFDKAFRRLGVNVPEPLPILLLGLERAKAMWRDPKFIPHPATWLNQERWDDEPATILEFPLKADDRQPSRPDKRTEYADRLSRIDAAMAAAVEQSPSG